ncbi:hypothetical protein KYB31_09290 [Clostridium felsineum]|uniref:hypothetical protein n=1 Tax=Clostridium felsineum TaxID=36839 RepID=UPI00214D1726|nr:hypothetical protein [Clostridium felsineum]MCR3759182.1 hypothetical protein [Clostridium felsineum]
MAIETIEIAEAIWNTSKRLDKGVDYITQKAKEFASAEKEYRIALSKEIAKLKSEGMSVTLIPDVARGNVAELKFQRDLAEQTYKASRDMLQALSNELSAMQSILKVQTKI